MQKNQFIYTTHKHLPSPDKIEFGKLMLEITHKESYADDDFITIKWICGPLSEGTQWYDCQIKYRCENYSLLPLLGKMKKAKINSSSTFEEVIDVLHANNVEHGLNIKLLNENQKKIFIGIVSISEIRNGKFTRPMGMNIFPGDVERHVNTKMKEKKEKRKFIGTMLGLLNDKNFRMKYLIPAEQQTKFLEMYEDQKRLNMP